MMSAAMASGLGVNTRTEVGGPCARKCGAAGDGTLLRALARYPNCGSSMVGRSGEPGGLTVDHSYKLGGLRARGQGQCRSLARACPAGGHSTARVVRR